MESITSQFICGDIMPKEKPPKLFDILAIIGALTLAIFVDKTTSAFFEFMRASIIIFCSVIIAFRVTKFLFYERKKANEE